jgi:hypothetical protein
LAHHVLFFHDLVEPAVRGQRVVDVELPLTDCPYAADQVSALETGLRPLAGLR